MILRNVQYWPKFLVSNKRNAFIIKRGGAATMEQLATDFIPNNFAALQKAFLVPGLVMQLHS